MKRFLFSCAVAVAVALFSRAAVADSTWKWPLPADQPGVSVPCSLCDSSILNKPTAPYSEPLRFTGRFQSGHWVGARQQPFRTAYAMRAIPDSKNNRIYMQYGSAIGVYKADSFFTRLRSREALMPVSDLPGLSYMSSMLIESFLKWDKWFYAEFTGMSQWWTVVVDGQDRLSSFDFDDRGDVYLATGQFGWGIVYDDGKTDGNFMPSRYQSPQNPPAGEEANASMVISLKSPSGRYYAIVGGGLPVMNVWDVTDERHPVRKPDFPHVFAVATKTDDRIAFKADDGKLYIYSIDGMLSNQAPLAVLSAPGGGRYLNATNDGTNFLALTIKANGSIAITKYAPDALRQNYSEAAIFDTGKSGSPISTIRYNGGYIAFSYRATVGYDSVMFRVTDSGLIEVPLNQYIHEYYVNSATYVAPGALPIDVQPYVVDGKVYLIVSAEDLGDVYEIRTNDSVSLAANKALQVSGVPAKRGTRNPNAPTNADATVFYGDTARFAATTSATSAQSIAWDFGNSSAAAGADTNTTTTLTQASGTGQIAVADHQYSGVNKPACASAPCAIAPFTVTAGGAPPSTLTTATLPFTVTAPQARIGVSNGSTAYTFIDSKYLLAQPNASAPVAIVAGDWFFDGSDGEVEGHYDTWSFVDNGVARTTLATLPYSPGNAAAYQAPVGDCGVHSLTFNAHYGPYGSTFSTLSGIGGAGSNYVESVGPFTYSVQAFAAAIDSSHPSDGSGNPVFHSLSRVSTAGGVLSAAQVAALNWQWDLVNGDTVVAAGPKGTGLPISDWAVSKSLISTSGLKVRLAIISPTDAGGGCGGSHDPLFGNLQTSKAYSAALNPPDPVLSGSCPNGVCSFAITSATNVDMTADHWQFSWSTSPAATSSSTTQATFNPVFGPGEFTITVSVIVKNDVGSKTLSTTIPYKNVSTCPQMNVNNVYPTLQGSTCSGGVCPANTAVSFALMTSGYNFSCSSHTFSWNFGDGQTVSGTDTAQHTYTTAGTYTVTVTVANSSQTFITSGVTFQVGASTPPPSQCPPMTVNNVYPVNDSATSACASGVCPANTSLSLTLATFGYSFACSTHNFSWNFGDGNTQSGGSTIQHSYANNGTYSVTATVSNSGQIFTTSPLTIQVSGGIVTQCPPMTVNNVYPVNTSSSTCPGGVCPTNQSLTLSLATFGYSFACSAHNFSWNFGDGNTQSGSSSIQHSYASAGTYSVTVTVSNSGQTFMTSPLTIQVGGGTVTQCPPMTDNNVYLTIPPACPGGQCPLNQPVTFSVQTFGYAFGCSTHTFTWDFGDGAPVEGGSTIQHSFSGRTDPYVVKVTIKNSVQTFSPATVSVSAKPIGIPANPGTAVSLVTEPLGALGAYRFTPAVTPQGVGINFHWDVRVAGALTPTEVSDKTGAVAFSPATRFTVAGTTYVVTVTVDGAAVASTSITAAPTRRRILGH